MIQLTSRYLSAYQSIGAQLILRMVFYCVNPHVLRRLASALVRKALMCVTTAARELVTLMWNCYITGLDR